MIARMMSIILGDGLLVGFVRVLLGVVCGVVLAAAVYDGTALAGVVLGLVLVAGLACVVGLRTALALPFSPNILVWHADPELGAGRRAMLLACGLGAAWLFWASFTAGLIQYGGLLAFLPLAASIVPRLWRARLATSVLRPGLGRHQGNVTERQATCRSESHSRGYRRR